jgi:hypothetical protein
MHRQQWEAPLQVLAQLKAAKAEHKCVVMMAEIALWVWDQPLRFLAPELRSHLLRMIELQSRDAHYQSSNPLLAISALASAHDLAKGMHPPPSFDGLGSETLMVVTATSRCAPRGKSGDE